MKKRIALLLSLCLLASLAACGEPSGSGEQPDSRSSSAAPERGLQDKLPGKQPVSTEDPEQEKITVVDAISEEGTLLPEEVIPFRYFYRVPEIQSDAPGAAKINKKLLQRYDELVGDAMDAGEVPECDEISYESYQNGDVLSLVVTYSFGMTLMMDYDVYHYDVERDRALGQDELPDLLGVDEEALHSAVVRAAAQNFDKTYHGMEEWEDDPGMYRQRRAETLGGYYLDNALVYLGEGEQPHVLLPFWTYAGGGVAFRDLPLAINPGKTGKLEDDLLDVSWDDTGVTIRFHSEEEDFWFERFQCGWTLEYDTDLPVAGLYSRYTDAVIHMARVNDPPILFLLTDQGRVEYVDLISCIEGDYFCGGGPLIGVENVTGFTGPDGTAPGRGGSCAYAALKDGSKVDLAEALAKSRQALPVSLTGSWQTTVTLQGFEGPYERAYVLDLDTGGWAEVKDTPLDMDGIDLYYSGTFTLLGETTDGMVYYYYLEPNGDGYDHIPYKGVLGLRATYDQDAWEDVLDATTLGVSLMSLFDDTLGEATRLNRGGEISSNWAACQVFVDFAPEGTESEEIILDSEEYAARLLFTAEGPVRDFTVLRLSPEVYYDDGSVEFSAEPIATGNLSSTNPVAVQLTFMGTIPNYGISYVDGSGDLRRFALIESGYDGSILLDEADPNAESFVLG